jgi:hypothetical protein
MVIVRYERHTVSTKGISSSCASNRRTVLAGRANIEHRKVPNMPSRNSETRASGREGQIQEPR